MPTQWEPLYGSIERFLDEVNAALQQAADQVAALNGRVEELEEVIDRVRIDVDSAVARLAHRRGFLGQGLTSTLKVIAGPSKVCPKCRLDKPKHDYAPSQFARQRGGWCRDCHNAYSAERRRVLARGRLLPVLPKTAADGVAGTEGRTQAMPPTRSRA
jgi:hypothetical protein